LKKVHFVFNKTRMSNLVHLPKEICEYSQLVHEKKLLNDQVRDINKKLKQLHPCIVEDMKAKELDLYELTPINSEEEMIFGGFGALQLKMRNEYDRINKANLILYTTQFFKYLMPDDPEDDVQRLGQGAGNWIWNNRSSQPKYYLERVYLDNVDELKSNRQKTAKKRKAELEANEMNMSDSAASTVVSKKPKLQTLNNTPRTREEFLSVDGFHRLLNSEQ